MEAQTAANNVGYAGATAQEPKRDPKVEELIQKAKQAKIEAAGEDADAFIEEMLDNPLQPKVVENKDIYLMESLKAKGLTVKPQWEEVKNEDGSVSRKKTGWSDVIIPER